MAEIRYCLAQKQRMDGAQAVVDVYSQKQVDRFNAMVDSYNNRCHDFRYQTGDLEEAQREVASYTQQFREEGRAMVRYGEAGQAGTTLPNAGVASIQMIRDAQKTLSALGYNVGVLDGLMGSRTRTAIERFQRGNGLPADGIVTGSLVERLHTAEVLRTPPQRQLAPSSSTPAKTSVDADIGNSSRPTVATTFVHAVAIGSCTPVYPTSEVREGHEGTVILSVRVGTDGGVTAVRIVSSTGSSVLDRAALDAIEQCNFVPANRGGQPAVDELRMPVSFALSGAQ